MQLVESTKMPAARAVLAHLATLPGPRLMVYGFVNGREQGYHVTNYVHAASFAVDRHSGTQIVVQFGKRWDFSSGNVLRSSLPDTREYFATPELAAEHIAVYFKQRPSSTEAEDPATGNTLEIRMDLVQALNELAPYVRAGDVNLSMDDRLERMAYRAEGEQ